MKKSLLVLGFLCLFAMVAAPASADTVFLDVTIAGLEDVDLGGFDFDVTYNDSQYAFERYFLTDALGSLLLEDAYDLSWGDDAYGTVSISLVSGLLDLSTQPDAFTLATLVFSTVDTLSSSDYNDFSLSNIDLSDADGGAIAYTVNGTDINVGAVPIPAGAWLLGSGLFGLVAVRRQRRG